MAGNWRTNFLRYAPFAPFCSVLQLCVIPGDVTWHVLPRLTKTGHAAGYQKMVTPCLFSGADVMISLFLTLWNYRR